MKLKINENLNDKSEIGYTDFANTVVTEDVSNDYITTDIYGNSVSVPYKIITDFSVLDIEDDEDNKRDELYDLQLKKLNELGYNFHNDYVIRFLDTDTTKITDINDATESLALKDGADLVEFKNGNIGFVGYYAGFKDNAFEILRHFTKLDKLFDEYLGYCPNENEMQESLEDILNWLKEDGRDTDYAYVKDIYDNYEKSGELKESMSIHNNNIKEERYNFDMKLKISESIEKNTNTMTVSEFWELYNKCHNQDDTDMEIFSWLFEHDDLYKDLCNHFNIEIEDEEPLAGLDFVFENMEKVIDWLSAHKIAWEDFTRYMKDYIGDRCNINESNLNEADYITIGGKRIPTNMSNAPTTASYSDAAKLGQKMYDDEQREIARKEKEEAERKEKERLEKESAPIMAKINDLIENNVEPIDAYFEVLVPDRGKADTVAGEIVRALSRVEYRWYNDGDMFFLGYGKETCSSSANYLYNNTSSEIKNVIDALINDAKQSDFYQLDGVHWDNKYSDFIKSLKAQVIAHLKNHNELVATPNDIDSTLSYPEFDIDIRKDWDIMLPQELIDHLDAEHIDEEDIIQYINDSYSIDYYDMNVSGDYVYFDDIDYDTYKELSYRTDKYSAPNLYTFLERYAEELTKEYGDSDEEDLDENVNLEESNK